jgi:uncharacterized damage-inducible protein DinB
VSVVRVDPPLAGDETATLLGFLDYHRDTLRMKVEGLDAGQLQATLPPSEMTLGGMVKHLAFVEHWWTYCVFEGHEYAEPWASVDWDADWDWDWHSAAGAGLEELLPLLDREASVTCEVVRRAGDLDRLSQRTGREGRTFSLRWILTHLLQEYARHNGHADVLRESIDGRVGE